MDFKPLKKDRKPGADGLFGWESPRLREALRAAKEAGKQLVAKGMTPTNYRTTKDVDMIARDLGAACLKAQKKYCESCREYGTAMNCLNCAALNRVSEEPAAERGCEQAWLPPQPMGCGPWIEGVIPENIPQYTVGTYLTQRERRVARFHFAWMPLATFKGDDQIVAYCLKESPYDPPF